MARIVFTTIEHCLVLGRQLFTIISKIFTVVLRSIPLKYWTTEIESWIHSVFPFNYQCFRFLYLVGDPIVLPLITDRILKVSTQFLERKKTKTIFRESSSVEFLFSGNVIEITDQRNDIKYRFYVEKKGYFHFNGFIDVKPALVTLHANFVKLYIRTHLWCS